MKTVEATWGPDQAYVDIRAPFNQSFINELKARIPWSYREWDPDTKCWSIKRGFCSEAINITRAHFGYCLETDPYADRRQQEQKRTTTPSSDPFRVLHLLPTAPWPVIDAAYKALAKTNHPDRGGDTAAMQRINAAYTELKDRTAS